MVKLNAKIGAFSIIESMVAMVIVVIMFSLSAMVIANVSSSGISREKQDAYMLAQSLRSETLKNKRFLDEIANFEDLVIEKTILDYQKSEKLKVLLIEVFKNEKPLYKSKEIIIIGDR